MIRDHWNSCCGFPPQNLEALLLWLHPRFYIACFCGSASDTLACGMYRSGIGISSCTGRLLHNGAQGVHPSRRRPPAAPAPGAQVRFCWLFQLCWLSQLFWLFYLFRIAGRTSIDKKTTLSFHSLPGICWPMRNRKGQWSPGPLQVIALFCSSWFPNE